MSDLCKKCHSEKASFDGFCVDCWPGYDMCKACTDYRCEHFEPTEAQLKDPDFTSCGCGSLECRTGFVEGSTERVLSLKQFRELRRSWGENVIE